MRSGAKDRLTAFVLLAALAVAWLIGGVAHPRATQAQTVESLTVITGYVLDNHGEPVEGATVALVEDAGTQALAETQTEPDGLYSLPVPRSLGTSLAIRVRRAHFVSQDIPLSEAEAQALQRGETLALPPIQLERYIGIAFWLATATFVLTLIIIATERLHNTLAALTGTAILLGVSYLGRLISPALFIFDFQRALRYVDWNVVFLIMGMMIYIAVVERTGIFQWLAFFAYRISGGRGWLLMPILLVITGLFSAFLDNVTTILIMAPFTVQIALALGINPLALLLPEVMAANVAGTSTLIGTPTNILVGSFADIPFHSFLVNLTPGVLLALVGLILFFEILYARDLTRAAAKVSPVLLQRLEENARITEPENLKKAGWVGLLILTLFLLGEPFHLVPAVTALIGATILVVWTRPNVEEMIESVDWTTLIFFITLFIVVGGIEEVGLVSMIADQIGKVVGHSLLLTSLTLVWLSALLSGAIDNIPFTAAMLPVVDFLTGRVPGASKEVLFFALAVGSDFGGNVTLIGASPNLVMAGISERAGYPVRYVDWLKRGLPVTAITLVLCTLWLLIRFGLLGGG
ncbi:MAG: anion permease [Chloroflexi bacterium]|nr:anion permease [Chloroflexota bacterium]